jgi:hypothetical protein
MQLINNQIFYNLENHLDMKAFDEINDKIALALAKNYAHCRPSGTGQATLYDQSTVSVFKERDRILLEMPELSRIEAEYYAKLSGASTLGTRLIVRGVLGDQAKYHEKHLKRNVIKYPFDDQFKFLFDWIDAQNCFIEYCRVIFWINESCQKTAFHRDYAETNARYKDVKDQFIWLTGVIPKRLVVNDSDTGKLHLSTCRACVFSTHNIHSSEGHPQYAAWSLRIDGKFNKEWAEKAGISEYFNL